MKSIKVKDSKGAVEAMRETAPEAIDAADMMDGAPNAGARQVPGKSTEPGPFSYRFSQTTPVTTAQIVAGAHKKSVDLQEGQNLSKLNLDTPPGGDLKEPGKDEKFETTRIG